jgi:hypothetical protein
LLFSSKEAGLEGSVVKTKCMFMSYEQNAGHDIKISFKVVAKIIYLE